MTESCEDLLMKGNIDAIRELFLSKKQAVKRK